MTDNEIIKALECCRKGKCRECCMDEEYLSINECTAELAKVALDLIQRQQERIERLKDNLDAVLKERAALDVDRVIEELKKQEQWYNTPDIKMGIRIAISTVKGVIDDR